MISSVSGFFAGSPIAAYRTISGRLDQLKGKFRQDPEMARDIAYLKSKIGTVKSADDLIKDRRLLTITLTAFNLEDKAFAKAFIGKVLEEGTENRDALAVRLVDPRYKELSSFFKFDGTPTDLSKPDVAEALVERFVTSRFEADAGNTSPALRKALVLQRRAPEVKTWYDVLSNIDMYEVVRTAAGLPATFSKVNIDRQVATLSRKMNVEDLKDPGKLGKIIDRYLAISGVSESTSMAASPMLMTAAPLTGFSPLVSLDVNLLLKMQSIR